MNALRSSSTCIGILSDGSRCCKETSYGIGVHKFLCKRCADESPLPVVNVKQIRERIRTVIREHSDIDVLMIFLNRARSFEITGQTCAAQIDFDDGGDTLSIDDFIRTSHSVIDEYYIRRHEREIWDALWPYETYRAEVLKMLRERRGLSRAGEAAQEEAAPMEAVPVEAAREEAAREEAAREEAAREETAPAEVEAAVFGSARRSLRQSNPPKRLRY